MYKRAVVSPWQYLDLCAPVPPVAAEQPQSMMMPPCFQSSSCVMMFSLLSHVVFAAIIPLKITAKTFHFIMLLNSQYLPEIAASSSVFLLSSSRCPWPVIVSSTGHFRAMFYPLDDCLWCSVVYQKPWKVICTFLQTDAFEQDVLEDVTPNMSGKAD